MRLRKWSEVQTLNHVMEKEEIEEVMMKTRNED
jgi:hypothetical protein